VADTTLTSDDHEWLVSQFLLWAKQPGSVHPTLHPLLSAFRKSIKGKRGPRGTLHPETGKFLDDLAASAKDTTPPAHFDVDEEAMFNMGMVAHRRSAQYAKNLIHFRGERSLAERSLNHPFFGLYPLSYMWGKVLPELTEFLMFRPFGFKSPVVAYNTVNSMYTSFMHQQAYDEDLRQYMYKNEPALRTISMFLPGVPWDMPVNISLWQRRLIEGVMTNQQRELEGKKPLNIDVGKIISDTIGYQIGAARSATTIPQTLGGATALPNIIGRAMGGDEPLPDTSAPQDTGPFSQTPLPQGMPGTTTLPQIDPQFTLNTLKQEISANLP
jgi:hypothetical protein